MLQSKEALDWLGYFEHFVRSGWWWISGGFLHGDSLEGGWSLHKSHGPAWNDFYDIYIAEPDCLLFWLPTELTIYICIYYVYIVSSVGSQLILRKRPPTAKRHLSRLAMIINWALLRRKQMSLKTIWWMKERESMEDIEKSFGSIPPLPKISQQILERYLLPC